MQHKICIIGGSGDMGQMTQNIFHIFLPNYNTTVFEQDDWNNNPQEKLANQDIVIISVPIFLTNEVIKKTIPHLSKGTILADYTSVKEGPLNTMLEHYSGPVVGLHPIFGPTIKSPKNQVIAICNGREKNKYKFFVDDLCNIGFRIEHMTANEHDKAMTFIQGIEHFSTYCLGMFLKHKNIDIEKMMRLASPVYKMELNIVGRLFCQDSSLYADIIMSDKSRENTISEFSDFISEHADNILNSDKQTFINNFNSVKNWMGDFANKAYEESDKLLLKK